MKVYLYTHPEKRWLTEQIIQTLEINGHYVLTNTPCLREEKNCSHLFDLATALTQVDVLLIESTDFTTKVLSTVSISLAKQVPTICLQEKGVPLPDGLRELLEDKTLKPLFRRLAYYRPKAGQTIRQILQRWPSRRIVSGMFQTVKFTLRLPIKFDHYLHWKTHNTALTKADFIRLIIQKEIMEKDSAYQRYVEEEARKSGKKLLGMDS
ncbi:MAG: hypothetical protein V1707_01740 [bacterium]